jgi:pimeloyl-ACP methyl ester carboxylesterase
LKEDLKPLANDLSKITARILFVHGDKDDWVPIENIAYGKKMMINASSDQRGYFKRR